MIYDVAIIGTGPAGGSAALHLANSGLNVIILEKTELPRFKPCGGAMPGSVTNLLPIDIEPVIEARATRIKNLHAHKDPRFFSTLQSPSLLVNRSQFDAFLIQHALEQANGSLKLREGFKVKSVEEVRTHATIYGEQQPPVQAKYIIAADGAMGRTAKCLGLNQDRHNAIAIDAELSIESSGYATESNQLTFNYYVVPKGYGWIFPKRNGFLSCGLGTWSPWQGMNLRKDLDTFLSDSFPSYASRVIEAHGYPLPVYQGRQKIASPRVCLVGDAASLVDPISGEGIRFALHSGRLAAETIKEIISTGKGSCCNYQHAVNRHIRPELESRLRFVNMVFLEAPDLFYQRFIVDQATIIRH